MFRTAATHLFSNIASFASTIGISDIVDIAIVTFLVYQVIRFIRETRAAQLVKGIILLFVMLQLSSLLNLYTIQYLLSNLMQLGFFALLIIFQPELRHVLEKMGNGTLGRFFRLKSKDDIDDLTINEIADAVGAMSKTKTGALICLERYTNLSDIIRSGTPLDAQVSSELLVNIFVPKTPLHDGAVIISGDRITAAACILPLTNNTALSRELGTRHRAAIGLSENSDSIVVVVSEETGKISLASDGSLARNLTTETLKKALKKALHPDSINVSKVKKSLKARGKNE